MKHIADSQDRRRVLHRRHGRVLVAHEGRAQARRRDRGRGSAPRGVKVIAHTAHHSAHETVELTQHAEEVGADFAILMNPYYPPMSEQTIYEWFQFVASRVNIGIWMFDADYAGYGLSPELIARIAEHREHLRHQDPASAREVRAGAEADPRQDRHERANGRAVPQADPRLRSEGASVVADAVSLSDAGLDTDARLHRARACRASSRRRRRSRSDARAGARSAPPSGCVRSGSSGS